MIVYLYGPDAYRRNAKFKEIFEAYTKKHGTGDVMIMDLEEEPEGWTRVRDFVQQSSLFSNSKLVVIRESGVVESKEWIKFLKICTELAGVFLLISDREAPLKAFSFLLEKPVQVQAYEELQGAELQKYVDNKLLQASVGLAPETMRFFIKYLGGQENRSFVVVQEIQKMRYAGFKSPLGLAEIAQLIPWFAKAEVFELAKYISGAADYGRALFFLEQIFLQKDAAAHLFNVLPYVARGKELVRLADLDISIKSGGLDYEEALLDFVIRR